MTEHAKKLLLLYHEQSKKNRTIQGSPPLTFKGKGKDLKNYRIYGNTETKTRSYSGSAPLNFPIVDGSVSNYRIHGNTENGESVGGLVTDSQSEHYGKYAIPITNNSETSNIYLDEPLRKVGDEAEYVDYAEQKWHRVRKNLLQNTATSQTINGVTFTVNEDGSVTCNGTASDTAECRLASNFSLPAGNYCLTGIPPSGNASSYYLRAWYNSSGSVVWINNYGNGCNFTLTDTTKMLSSIVVWSGKVLDNITFYPMIRKADIEDDTYEPYIENTEVDVTVPALPSQSSSNSLSVGTAVQPSSLAVDVDEVVSCGDKVTDSQSVNYGKYKIHVTLTADSTETTTDIYLDEPLAKSGNNTDYIDYATQKRHNSDGTSADVELPALPTLSGTNTLSVGTTVQPSEVEIKGKIKAVQEGGGQDES